MQKARQELICPICQSLALIVRHVIKGFTYFTCQTCGTTHIRPFPSPEEAIAWYKIDDYFKNRSKDVGYIDYFSQKNAIRKTFSQRNNFFSKFAPLRDKDVLEIGCGPGLYPLTLKEWGIRSYFGLDLNPYAIEALHERHFAGAVGSLGDLGIDQKFDIIAFFDVFEHIQNPHAFLDSIRRILRKEGYIYLTTPSTASLLARLSGKHWVSYIVPQHVFLYNRESLSGILKRHDFRLIKVSWDIQWITFSFLWDHIWDLWPRANKVLGSLPAMKDRRVLLPIPNGQMRVIARTIDS